MISLCVCVYNSEHYLDDLFKSFIKQTRKDFKVLVVDNNSTDNSIEVISKYKNDLDLRIVKEEKQGIQFARQKALDEIETDNFCFIDSDDVIGDKYIEIMYSLIDKYGEDYVPEVCYKVFDDGDTIPSTQISSKTKLLNKEKGNCYGYCIYKNKIRQGNLWNKCYSIKVVKANNISFDERISCGEDRLFHDKYINCVKGIALNFSELYFYRVRTNSLVNNIERTPIHLKKIMTERIYIEYVDNVIKKNTRDFIRWSKEKAYLLKKYYNFYLELNDNNNAEIEKKEVMKTLMKGLFSFAFYPSAKLNLLLKIILFKKYIKRK